VGGLTVMSGVFLAAGCGRESADSALDASLAKAGVTKEKVYPLAGHITIDGSPPQVVKPSSLIVMLYDPAKPDLKPAQRRYVEVAPNGSFVFATYGLNDGAPAGKYIVLIAEMKYKKRRGYQGPDQLKNQYNDPDKNASLKEFTIEHAAPGKKDYEFALTTSEGEAAAPGPKSLTTIPEL